MARHEAQNFTRFAVRRNSAAFISLTILVSVVVFTFLVGLPGSSFSPLLTEESHLRTVERLFSEWKLIEAELALKPLLSTSHTDRVDQLHGKILLARGELIKAYAILLTLAAKDTARGLSLLFDLGFALYELGKLDSAETVAQSLRETALARGDTTRLAEAYYLLGRIAFNRVHYDSAFSYQTQSLEFARHAGSKKTEADALRQLGVLSWYRGKLNLALESYYEPALELYRKMNDKNGEATTLSNIGLVHQQQGDWETNLRYQILAYDIRRRIGDQVGLCDSYYFLTQTPPLGKELSVLRSTYVKKNLELSTRIGYAWGREIALKQLEDLMHFDFRLPNRLGGWRDSTLTTISGESLFFGVQRDAWRLAEERRYREAEPLLRRTAEIADSLGYRSMLTAALIEYGYGLIMNGKYHLATAVFTRARSLAWREAPQFLPRAEMSMALLAQRMGKHRQAKAMWSSVIRSLDSLYLAKLSSSENDLGFHTALASVYKDRTQAYEGMVRFLAERMDAKLFSYVERERSLPFWGERDGETETTATPARQAYAAFVRAIEEYESHPQNAREVEALLIALGEARQTIIAEQRAIASATPAQLDLYPVTLAQLQRSLQPNEVFVEFCVVNERTLALVVRAHSFIVIPIDMPEERLTDLVNIYRETILRGKQSANDSLWKGPAHQLYRSFIAPLEERRVLHRGDHLIISPHRALLFVPFHTLTPSTKTESPRFLIETYDISYALSASHFVKGRTQTQNIRSLTAVLPDTKTLQHTETEILQIPSDIGTTRSILKGNDATAKRVLREAFRSDIVHIAAHARFNDRFPLYSGIQCSDRKLELHELLGAKTNARLIVLSACETGVSTGAVGAIPSGADFVSLPRALLSAGASNVIASLWLVEDESTAVLMRTFYQNISTIPQPTIPFIPSGFSRALSSAQRQFISNARSQNAKIHPFSWGGFFLTGQ